MGEIVVVTGGSKGIGLAIAEAFAAIGYDVVLCARSEVVLKNAAEKINETKGSARAYYMAADLSQKSGVDQLVEFINDLGRPIGVLVNNAGIYKPGTIMDEPEGNLELMFSTNVLSAYHLTRALVPKMKRAKKGHVFNICSTASITAYVNGGSYCISKFAMLGMTKVLREEMKPHRVRVTAILPGATLTSSWEGVDLPPDRFMQPEDVAKAVIGAFKLSDQSVIEELILRPQEGDI